MKPVQYLESALEDMTSIRQRLFNVRYCAREGEQPVRVLSNIDALIEKTKHLQRVLQDRLIAEQKRTNA